jgi:chitodextrinase
MRTFRHGLTTLLLVAAASSASAALRAPRGLAAEALAGGAVALTWEDTTRREIGFEIERSTTPTGGFVRIATTPKNAAAYTDGGLGPGTYHYRVRAVGRRARAASPYSNVAGVVLLGAAGNQPPVADAGPDQLTQTLTPLAFDGRRSRDPDGTVVGWAWSFGDGAGASDAVAVHAYATPGTYTVTLTVTDDGGLTASDTATVSVANRPPVAAAGPDRTAEVGQALAFDGSGSSDPDGRLTGFVWSFGDGATASGVTASHAWAEAGTYLVTLTVTDDRGAVASDGAVVTVAAPSASGAWTRTAGSAGDDRGHAVAIDGGGNLLVTGYFSGTVDFGGGPLTSEHLPHLDANQYKDVFVARYSPAGTHLWSRRIGADYDDRGHAIAVGPGGDAVVAGSVSNYVDFGDGVTTTTAGAFDAFVARYAAADGRHVWSRRFGNVGNDAAFGVAVDGGGNVVVVGHFEGAVDFGGGPLVSAGGLDVFVARFSPAGAHLWSRRFGGSAFDYGYAAAVDPAGNVLVAGAFFGSGDFGSGPLSSAGGADVFAVKLTPSGAVSWAKRFGGSGDDYAYGAAADGAGSLLLTGSFHGSAGFGGPTLTSAGGSDAFLVKLSPTGGHVWSKRFGDGSADRGQGVAVDAQGNVAVAGSFQGSADFGGGPLASLGIDVFLASYAPTGAYRWAQRLGPSGNQFPGGVASAGGAVAATGYFQYTLDAGDGPRPSAGSFDAFLTRLVP